MRMSLWFTIIWKESADPKLENQWIYERPEVLDAGSAAWEHSGGHSLRHHPEHILTVGDCKGSSYWSHLKSKVGMAQLPK